MRESTEFYLSLVSWTSAHFCTHVFLPFYQSHICTVLREKGCKQINKSIGSEKKLYFIYQCYFMKSSC